jgi:hypothetical protein
LITAWPTRHLALNGRRLKKKLKTNMNVKALVADLAQDYHGSTMGRFFSFNT